jgi:hypothetical protein
MKQTNHYRILFSLFFSFSFFFSRFEIHNFHSRQFVLFEGKSVSLSDDITIDEKRKKEKKREGRLLILIKCLNDKMMK